MAHRLGAAHIRHVLEQFRTQECSATEAAEALGVSRRRLYQLHHDYLQAYGAKRHRSWQPGHSGGNHAPAWPEDVVVLLHRRLQSDPPSSYSFAASEALRLHGFKLDRAQVRRWALAEGIGHKKPPVRRKAAVRR